ncbi:MAG: hypothetical protein U5P41_09275 [Gammaproteobacteria bacterium]|nr:hypothetical protein [Gammaproteobacteria bacterium]
MMLSSRPKRDLPLAYLVGRLENVPCILLLHTAALSFRKKEKKEKNLEFSAWDLFDLYVVHSHALVSGLRHRRPDANIVVSGWPSMQDMSTHGDRPAPPYWRPGEVFIGYPLVGDYELVEPLARAAKRAGVVMVFKGRAPGGDRGIIVSNVPVTCRDSVIVYDYKDITLREFFAGLDGLITGRTNVGFEAVEQGMPVISMLSEREKREYRRRDIEPYDFAYRIVHSRGDLERSLVELRLMSTSSKAELAASQQDKYHSLFPGYDVSTVTGAIENVAKLNMNK